MFCGIQTIILLTISTSAFAELFDTFSRSKRNALDNTISSTTPIPSSFDYRDYGKVTPVKSQGQCGSAWAHATVASIESQYLLRSNLSLDLSEQTLLNCEMRSDLCYSSDTIIPSFEYARDVGIPLESCAPYTSGANGNVEIYEGCDSCTEQRYKIAGFRRYGANQNGTSVTYSEAKIAEDLYNFGPAAVVIYLPPRNNGTHDFYDNVNYLIKNYTGGVLDFSAEVCSAKCMQMTVVLLVGYTPDYWIAKGSFGSTWGENGYMRFRRGTNFCSMTRTVIAPFLEAPNAPALTASEPPTPPPAPPTTTVETGWTEWAAASCTADCGQCGRVVMKRSCRGGDCPGEDTMNSTTKCGAASLCPFPLPSCCAPAKRAIYKSALTCV